MSNLIVSHETVIIAIEIFDPCGDMNCFITIEGFGSTAKNVMENLLDSKLTSYLRYNTLNISFFKMVYLL